MKEFLAVLAFFATVVSAWMFYQAFEMAVTVSNYDGTGEVANLQLLQIQSNLVLMGVGSAIIASINLAGVAVISAVDWIAQYISKADGVAADG